MSQGRAADAEIQGYYCPLQPARLVEKRLRSGKCILTDLGLEKRCAKCDSYWPMDTQFWFASKTEDGLFAWCRACYTAQRWPMGRSAQKAAEDHIAVPSFPFEDLPDLAGVGEPPTSPRNPESITCQETAWTP